MRNMRNEKEKTRVSGYQLRRERFVAINATRMSTIIYLPKPPDIGIVVTRPFHLSNTIKEVCRSPMPSHHCPCNYAPVIVQLHLKSRIHRLKTTTSSVESLRESFSGTSSPGPWERRLGSWPTTVGSGCAVQISE